MQCLQLENSTGSRGSMATLHGRLEREAHRNPRGAALLCHLLWLELWVTPRCSSVLVTMGVPTEVAASAELCRRQTLTGRAVGWFNLCWSRKMQVSNLNIPGHQLLREDLFSVEMIVLMIDFLVLVNIGVVYCVVFAMKLREKEKQESFRQ